MRKREMRVVSLRAALVLSVAALLPSGCSPSFSSLTGKVLMNEVPLESGIVSAIAPDGKISTAQIGANGAYRIDNIQVGTVKIIVMNEQDSMIPGSEEIVKKFGADGPPPRKKSTNKVLIPEQYSNPETSGLTATVKSSETQHDIRLTK